MKIYRYLAVLCCVLVVPLFLTNFVVGSDTKKTVRNDVCSASNPASICAAANTCGSASSPCSIDIKRDQGVESVGLITDFVAIERAGAPWTMAERVHLRSL
jgi:hypothetical protein